MSEPTTSPLPSTITSAPLWRRFAAMVYDGFILLALSFGYGAILTGLGAWLGPKHAHDYTPMFHSPWVFLGWLAVLVGFYWYFWRRGGQTIGMKTWRLQLQSNIGGPVSVVQMAIRSLSAVVGLALLGLGYFYQWVNPQRQCLHDRLSNTQVVVLPKAPK